MGYFFLYSSHMYNKSFAQGEKMSCIPMFSISHLAMFVFFSSCIFHHLPFGLSLIFKTLYLAILHSNRGFISTWAAKNAQKCTMSWNSKTFKCSCTFIFAQILRGERNHVQHFKSFNHHAQQPFGGI